MPCPKLMAAMAAPEPAFDGRLCPGRYYAGKALPLCAVKCRREGGNDLAPAAEVVTGQPHCVNFLPFAVDAAEAL